jgi:Spy/CpxP family protein refolding chaperone
MKRIGLILLLAGASAWAQQTQDPARQLAERQAQLAQLKALEASLTATLEATRQRYSDNHPDVINLRDRLAQIHRDLVAQQLQTSTQQQLSRDLKANLTLSRASPLSLGGLRGGGSDKWWNNPDLAAAAGLTKDQQRKMDDVFLQYRLKLIDLNAALEREEVALEPLVATDALDQSKIEPQIDRIAQARAELEKANGRMLLGIRMLLTPEQWKKMQK